MKIGSEKGERKKVIKIQNVSRMFPRSYYIPQSRRKTTALTTVQCHLLWRNICLPPTT